jgi:two-component sensor histidine kinase
VDSLLNIASKTADTRQSLMVHLRLAKIILNGHQSLKYAKKSLQLGSNLQDRIKMADAYIEIGNDYGRINNLADAAEAIFAAATLYKQAGHNQGHGVALNTLGQLYFNQHQYSQASTYFRTAIQLHSSISDSIPLADDYNNLGEVYRVQQAYDSALYYFTKAQAIYKAQRYDMGIAYSLGNRGLVLAATGRKDAAENDLHKATAILQTLNDFYPVAVFNIEMAKVSLASGDSITAAKLALQGYNLAQREGLKEQVRDASWVLYTLSEADKAYEKALDYLNTYHASKDSILNEQSIQKIADLQTEYQVAQQEEQVSKLTAQNNRNLKIAIFLGIGLLIIGVLSFYLFWFNKGLKIANATLDVQRQQLEDQKAIIQEALKEKETLLKEIHHRVKNNLQIISSLLNLQSHNLEDSQLIEIFQTGQSRIQSIALIHQKLYQNDEFTIIDIQEYIEHLSSKIIDTLLHPATEVRVQVKSHQILLDIDTAVPLGLIINELLTNSVKYAFTGMTHGCIDIQISRLDEHGYKLLYADSGCGLPEGLQLECAETLGSKLINILTRQLGGQIAYYTDQGAHFIIKFYDMVKRKEMV